MTQHATTNEVPQRRNKHAALVDLVGQDRELFHRKHKTRNEKAQYDQRIARLIGTDIAPLPEIKNPEQREACAFSFKLFCESYFPNRFYLRWSNAQIDTLNVMEQAVRTGGGYYALAEPRGGGKTTRAECLALYALLYGYRRFVVCIGATNVHAKELFQSIVSEIETNDALISDFPEVCYPIQRLEGNPQKAKSQHVEGTLTRVHLTADMLTFPFVTGSTVSGSCIRTVSITGRVRGMKHTIANSGRIIRPDLVILDDPQTDKSARSPRAVESREKIITGAIMGLSGPDTSITAIMPCTVIKQDDLADRFLDRERRPEWRGQSTPMIVTWPTDMKLWQQYYAVLTEGYKTDGTPDAGNAFYIANRDALDAGCALSWDERYNPQKEVSAIQSAMNLYFRDPRAFHAEYQNKPLIESNTVNASVRLESKEIIQRVSGVPHGLVPPGTVAVTTGIDLQLRLAYYLTVAWVKDFGGVILDYGTAPEQPANTTYFNASAPPRTLQMVYPELTTGPAIYKALETIDEHLSKPFGDSVTGQPVGVDKALIDANWHETTDTVYAFCRAHMSRNMYLPAHGRGIKAGNLPMALWPKKSGEKHGKNWRTRSTASRGKHVDFDTNYWKSIVGERLVRHVSSDCAIKVYGDMPYIHQMLADHLSSEVCTPTTGRGRVVHEWVMKPGAENHWFDCLVMAAVGASMCGVDLYEIAATDEHGKDTAQVAPKRQRVAVALSELG